jgi:hypothetical protein
MISYARIGILAGIFIFGLLLGWTYEHRALVAYKADVKAQADIQIAKNESIKKQQEIVNKGIINEYQAKLSAVRNYYTSGVQHSSSRNLPSISNPTSGVNESATDQLLACAYTTQQLVSLQDWINIQVGIK